MVITSDNPEEPWPLSPFHFIIGQDIDIPVEIVVLTEDTLTKKQLTLLDFYGIENAF